MKIEIDTAFRGNAYIIQNDTVLLDYSGGFADLANEIPNTFETRFASASMGKTFVAVGILQLIGTEKLHFEDTIGELLDFDLKRIDPDVTVKELLNHTSGVPDYFDESVMDDYEALWTDFPNYRIRKNKDMLPLFIDKPMMYRKGEKFQYNNTGYILLAMIIEKIAGMDFDEYLQKNVFDKCGMCSAGYFAFDRLPAKCANSYIYCPETDDYRTNIYSVGAKGTGDGGAFVTVGDIVKFWNGLIRHELLSKEMVSAMFSKQSGDGKDSEEGYYGFGVWIIENPEGQDYVYMQGCDDGVSAISEYNPNNGMITVLLSNYGDNVWSRMRKIREEVYVCPRIKGKDG
ncbi:MAG: beta-lactamase family protein [Lachnospiraceae bacterium]|nr:beta-lactamase family protein [Lachnospiraceae bacterium]